MTIETHIRDVVILDPEGRLTVETVAGFSEAVRRVIEMGHSRVLLNLATVPQLDASGLGAIARTRSQMNLATERAEDASGLGAIARAWGEARRSGGELARLAPTALIQHL